MKLLVVHDNDGNIRSVAFTNATERLRAGLRVERGERVTEVEVKSAVEEELRSNPREFCEKFRLDEATNSLLPKKR
jgi:hypothetical protein